MSKKLTIALFALLFVVSGMQSLAISKISKSQDLGNANVASVINSTNQLRSNLAVQNPTTVNTATVNKEVDLESYLKEKYPADYQKRINAIDSSFDNIMAKNGLVSKSPSDSISNKFYCEFFNGVFYTAGNEMVCLMTYQTSSSGVPSSRSGDMSKYLALGLDAVNKKLSSIIYGDALAEDQDFKSWNTNYKTELPKIISQLEMTIAQNGINLSTYEPDVNAISKRRCRRTGGTWVDEYTDYGNGVTQHSQGCVWLMPS